VKISTILDQIDLGNMALPEFQRGYVWNRDQVRELMQSLYRRYPIGSLLVWVAKTDQTDIRGDGSKAPGVIDLILDGQQRITSLYGIIRGRTPKFFDGNEWAFTGLYFNLESEMFEFYAPMKMKDNPRWIDVTDLMGVGIGQYIKQLYAIPEILSNVQQYIDRLNAITGIKDVDLHVEQVTGEDKTIDVVVDIFNRVNSGGTKLSSGDLALARICARWPDARQEMKNSLRQWEKAGFYFNLDWLLRNINTIVTGEARFAALGDVPVHAFQEGLIEAQKACNYLLNMIAGRLGLDHDRVLGGRYAFPVMSRLLVSKGGKLQNARQMDKLLYWYIHSFLWGRYTGSTESTLNQDLHLIDASDDPLDRLINQLRLWRGTLSIQPEDFRGSTLGARFYPMLYLLTRVFSARDWNNGLPLSANLLGKQSRLHIHHIFPKALLYKHGFTASEVNSIANFCFLTQEANLEIRDKKPKEYFEVVEKNLPGALASQWVPMDRQYWEIEHYKAFLTERQKLLAQAANAFLDELLNGMPSSVALTDYSTELTLSATPTSMDEKDEVQSILSFVTTNGLPRPELDYEVADSATGETVATVDMAWPKGIQEEFSQPIAVVLEGNGEVTKALNQAGYRFFTDTKSFYHYLEDQMNGNFKPFTGGVAGADDFVAAIVGAQEDEQPILHRLSDWAIKLENEGLVKLLTYYGKSGWLSLLPRLEHDDVGLVSIYNINGKASLQLWRSVFIRRAPKSLARVEQIIGEIGQGTHTHEFGDELLNTLTIAYREAAGIGAKG
jgi:Protein of unknown function DUF262